MILTHDEYLNVYSAMISCNRLNAHFVISCPFDWFVKCDYDTVVVGNSMGDKENYKCQYDFIQAYQRADNTPIRDVTRNLVNSGE